MSSAVCRFGLLALCLGASACDLTTAKQPASAAVGSGETTPKGKTLGFVLIDLDFGIHQTRDGKAECPDGLAFTNRQQWEAQFPTSAARRQQLRRCGGDIRNRGPHCENVWFAPRVIDDPLPHREATGAVAYGLDLDGTTDGAGTATTCAHQNFVSPDGVAGIDNQLYRFYGCNLGMRIYDNRDQRMKLIVDYTRYRTLLEITGVDDERNDEAVEVALYQGRDPLLVDAEGKASRIPGQSQQIAPGGLLARLQGRIADGVLETEPADHLTNLFWAGGAYPLIRDMRLRLTLTSAGAQGIQAGYIDVETYWQEFARYTGSIGDRDSASGPSAYAALHRLADGHKDPGTGKCTAISAGRNLEFVRAILVHPLGGEGAKEIGQ
jgi:hypothetical protein